MANGKASQARAIEIQERRGKALNLRRSGASLRDIARQLSISAPQAQRDIEAALKSVISENTQSASSLRAMELDRLDRMLLSLSSLIYPTPAFAGAKAPSPDLKAMDRAIRIVEQRAKLLGLYAPVQQQIDIHHTWQDEAISLIKSGEITYEAALETFDHDDTLVRELFAKAQVPVSTGQSEAD